MAETSVPSMSVSMMMPVMPMITMLMCHTTVASILNGSFPYGSNVVDQNAKEPFVIVSDLMKIFN